MGRALLRGGSSPSLLRLRVETDVGTVSGVVDVAVRALVRVLVRDERVGTVVVTDGRDSRGG